MEDKPGHERAYLAFGKRDIMEIDDDYLDEDDESIDELGFVAECDKTQCGSDQQFDSTGKEVKLVLFENQADLKLVTNKRDSDQMAQFGLVCGKTTHKVPTNPRPVKVCRTEKWTPSQEQAELLVFGMGLIEADNRAWVDF